MLATEAVNKICPTGAGIGHDGFAAVRLCAGENCMAWRWREGHETPHEERWVWYGDNLYPLPAVPEDRSDYDEHDLMLIQMLRDCHATIRAAIVREWHPAAPDGDGWTLAEKRWDAGEMKPRARFTRARPRREGDCGFVGLMRSWSVCER